MDFNIVDVLNTGVTGFAFLMLFLGFKLTSSVQSRILAQNPEAFSNIEMYREWTKVVKSQLTNTRYFLGVALCFFVGGLGLLMYQAESRIVLAVSPLESTYAPLVHHQSEKIDLSDTGRVLISVRDAHNISISNEKLMRKLHELNLSLEDSRNAAGRLAVTHANRATDSGF